MTPLSDLLNEVNHGLSARELARRAQKVGASLSHDTAAKYLRGKHGTPDEPTLAAFAQILPVSLARLRRAAGLPSDRTDPYVPPVEASRLSLRQRRAVDEVIRSMLESKQAQYEADEAIEAIAETQHLSDRQRERLRQVIQLDINGGRATTGAEGEMVSDPVLDDVERDLESQVPDKDLDLPDESPRRRRR